MRVGDRVSWMPNPHLRIYGQLVQIGRGFYYIATDTGQYVAVRHIEQEEPP
jgi:hypothetical protein